MRKIAIMAAGAALLMSVIPALAGHSPLVARYPLNKDAKDSSGHGHDGTVNGATLVRGRFGRALDFDGDNDYVEIPHSANLNTVNQITVETWFKPENVAQFGSRTDIVHKSHEFLLGFGIGSWGSLNGVHFNVFQGGNHPIGVQYPFQNGEWYHIAGTFDGSQIKIYVNGELKDTANWTGTINPNISTVRISENIIHSNSFDGLVDEVRIWNCALTADEIAQHAKSNSSAAPSCQGI